MHDTICLKVHLLDFYCEMLIQLNVTIREQLMLASNFVSYYVIQMEIGTVFVVCTLQVIIKVRTI